MTRSALVEKAHRALKAADSKTALALVWIANLMKQEREAVIRMEIDGERRHDVADIFCLSISGVAKIKRRAMEKIGNIPGIQEVYKNVCDEEGKGE